MANILLCALLCALVLRASGVTRSETFPDGAVALPEPPCARGALCKETPPGGSCCDPSEGEEAPVDQQQDRPALEERRMAVPSGGQMRATLRLPADVPYGLFLFAFCTVLVFLVVFCCSSWYFRGCYSRKKRSLTEQLQQSCPEGQGSLESPGPSDVDLPLHHGASAEMALPLVVADEPSDLLDCTPAEQLRAGNCEAEGNTVSPGTIPLPIFPPRDREPTVENESEDKMERPEC